MNRNPRMSRSRMALPITLVVLAVAWLLLPVGASAQTPDGRGPVALAVAAPEDVPLGNLARIVAILRDDAGQPLARARIVFTSPATFAGTIGELTLGEIATNDEGLAILDYQLRIQGQNQVIARFYGDPSHQPAEASATILATGQAQLSHRTAGVDMPLIRPWTLIVLIAGVWSVYFAAMLLVAGIPASRGERATPGDRGGNHGP